MEIVDAKKQFFQSLKNICDPEDQRDHYSNILHRYLRQVGESGARYLLHGMNRTDIEESTAGIKRQGSVLEQLGIDTKDRCGYRIVEPLIQLRKPAIRKVAEASGLPKEIYTRPPFPGPALATRVIEEVTPRES